MSHICIYIYIYYHIWYPSFPFLYADWTSPFCSSYMIYIYPPPCLRHQWSDCEEFQYLLPNWIVFDFLSDSLVSYKLGVLWQKFGKLIYVRCIQNHKYAYKRDVAFWEESVFFFSSPFGPTDHGSNSQLVFFCVFLLHKKWFCLNGVNMRIWSHSGSPKATNGPSKATNGTLMDPQRRQMETPQRCPIGTPKETNRAPIAVQRHPRQPKGSQRSPNTGHKSQMKPRTQKIALMASFSSQYPNFNVSSGISNITFKTSC